MALYYENTFALRTGDFDKNRRLTPTAILDLCQTVAGAHAEKIGCGFAAMLEKQQIWVLSKVRYRVLQSPAIHTNVRVATWPLAPEKVTFRREYKIMAEDGTPLILADSQWVVVHSEKRRVLPAGNVYGAGQAHLTEESFGPFMKVADFAADAPAHTVVPTFSDMDMNDHVNNTRYAAWVLDALGDVSIAALQIDYHRELQAGQQVALFTQATEGGFLAKGVCGGSTTFNCKVETE